MQTKDVTMLKICVVAFFYLNLVLGESIVPRQIFGEIEAVRLVGGADERSGRLEAMSGGVWGTVCDDGFDNREARVVCRSLGFNNNSENAGSAALSRTYFPRAPRGSRVLLDEVTCRGTESSLNECGHRPIGTSNCVHWEDVAIFCGSVEIDAVRLSDHRHERGGRVEVNIQGVWGTVWSSQFDTYDANVICRSLGYKRRKVHLPAVRHNHFLLLGKHILMHGLPWGNKLDNMLFCGPVYMVTHGERCDPIVTQIRLVDGVTSREGRLEVFMNGSWGTVCDDYFNTAAARVSCRMLGLRSASAVQIDAAPFYIDTGPVLLDDISCTGSERDLNSCRFNTNTDCFHLEDVAIRCA